MPGKKRSSEVFGCDKEHLSCIPYSNCSDDEAAAIHTPTEKRLMLKIRRVSRWRMLKKMIRRIRE